MIVAHDAPPAIERTVDSPGRTAHAPGDPAEHTNRVLYRLNDGLDRILLRPVAMSYRRWLPRPVRTGIRNVLDNLDEPAIAVNDLLQGRPRPAGSAVLRFASNSTVGVLGIFDVARVWGLHPHDNDFGLTLARHGAGAGPYLFVPVLGPSSVRDVVGLGVDFAIDPLNLVKVRRGASAALDATVALEAIDDRGSIDADLRALQLSAADPYASIRSVYLQTRAAEVRDGRTGDLPDIPDDTPAMAEDAGAPTDGQRPAADKPGADK